MPDVEQLDRRALGFGPGVVTDPPLRDHRPENHRLAVFPGGAGAGTLAPRSTLPFQAASKT